MSGYDQVRGFPEEKETSKTRLIEVEIYSYNPDKRSPVVKKETMAVDTLISALAGSIQNVAKTVEITPAIGHDRIARKIDDLAAAIVDLSADVIEPFTVDFPYSAGTSKTYTVIGEVK